MAENGDISGCMRHDLPTLSDFRMVESVARNKTIRAAAKELSVSPSVLSRQLGLLEVKLGFTVFDRDTRNIKITKPGKKFIQAAARILKTTEEAMNNFNTHLDAVKGRLTIASVPSVTGVLLPRLLASFKESNPDIDLEIQDFTSSGVENAIANGNVELGFTPGSDFVRSKCSFIPLFEDSCIAISSKKSTLKKECTMEDILKFPIISAKKGTSYRDIVESSVAKNKLEYVPRIEVTHIATAVALVAEGLGVLIVAANILPAFNSKLISVHKIKDLKVPRQVGISYPTGKALSPIADKFVKHARKVTKSLYKSLMEEIVV